MWPSYGVKERVCQVGSEHARLSAEARRPAEPEVAQGVGSVPGSSDRCSESLRAERMAGVKCGF